MATSITATTMAATPRPEPRWRRLALSAAVLAFAAIAAGSGLDRLAATSFVAEDRTPQPLRVVAEARAADRLIESGIPESALVPAQRLMARDPLGNGSAALLGAALLGQGQTAAADRAFRLAARRGWRDARTQLYWLRVALAQDEPQLAALRFGALARQWPQAPAVGQIAAVFEATPAGRQALAERIVAGDRWATAYARPADDAPLAQLATRGEVLRLAAAKGAKLGCTPIAPLVSRLIESDALAAARLWQGHCATAQPPGALADPSFALTDFAAPAAPFSWEFPGDGALRLDFVNARGARALQVSNSGALALVFAAQRMAIGPGRYRLTVKGDPTKGLLASLSCRQEFEQAAPVALTAGRADLVFAGPCGAPWLQLWLVPAQQAPVSLTTVDLKRL